jgi:hypothetical protein
VGHFLHRCFQLSLFAHSPNLLQSPLLSASVLTWSIHCEHCLPLGLLPLIFISNNQFGIHAQLFYYVSEHFTHFHFVYEPLYLPSALPNVIFLLFHPYIRQSCILAFYMWHFSSQLLLKPILSWNACIWSIWCSYWAKLNSCILSACSKAGTCKLCLHINYLYGW